MSGLRFFAVILIFAGAGAAWIVLGGNLEYRTARLSSSLGEEVNNLWGPAGLEQDAPEVQAARGDSAGAPLRSDVTVSFVHRNRYKGLLWFSTYTVEFAGKYTVQSPAADAQSKGPWVLRFVLPVNARAFENLSVALDGKMQDSLLLESAGTTLSVPLPSDGGEHVVAVAYKTRGRDRWLYSPVPYGAGQGQALLRNFVLTATTDFAGINYPKGSVSPVEPARISASGATAVWKYDNIRMSQSLGIEMPIRQNAGPVAARMSFFAPVSLFFFFTVLFAVMVLKRIPLHPMHYLFIAAGFFAFHILMAYLVDIVWDIQLAFWICAGVSVLLVVTYMRLVAGIRFALLYTGLAQLVYLVGFSYAFFWEGRTGLVVTIGAICTLFVLMQATGRVNWQEVFRRPAPVLPPPPPWSATGGPPPPPVGKPPPC
jgi:hypothetical protein